MTRFLTLAILAGFSTAVASDLPFYAFQNGVRFSNDDLRAGTLEELGYDGIGSASLPKNGELEPLFTTYESRGLKVFSFYVGIELTAEGAAIPPALLESIPEMKGHEVVLELFVKGDKSLPTGPAVAAVRKIADLAGEAGVSVVLYPHTNFAVETIGEAVELARTVDRANVGVMFNLCHFLRVEPKSGLRETLASAGPLLRQVSISGADEGGKDWSALIQPLGEGTYDVGRLMKILDDLDFKGPVGLQCFNIQGKSADFLAASKTAWETVP